tara:strand:- start:225 stop:791 length:567 start_codon:yes stop_codon:yes gene_type:complete
MEWNNGTIFRVFINSGTDTTVDCKVDIAQQELNNDCFIGVENFVLKPDVSTNELQTYWSQIKYLQLESVQLTPYIDFTSQNITGLLPPQEANQFNQARSQNTSIFARLPLIASPTLGSGAPLLTTEATFAGDRVLNKDSILYEMRNNPNALSNGRLRFRMLDEFGGELQAIRAFAFTLVVYKPSNVYN